MTLKLNGSTAGSVSIDAPADTSPTGTDVTLTLPTSAGSSGQYLQTNGSGGLSWAGAGKILQVVNATYSTHTTSSNNTWIDTGLTASITPSSSNSKILVTVFQVGLTASNNAYGGLKLVRNTTDILTLETEFAYIFATGTWNNIGASGCSYLDSPSTTSSVTYKTQFRSVASVDTVEVQRFGNSTITLMEVAA